MILWLEEQVKALEEAVTIAHAAQDRNDREGMADKNRLRRVQLEGKLEGYRNALEMAHYLETQKEDANV